MILPNVTLESTPALIRKYEEEQVFACVSTDSEFMERYGQYRNEQHLFGG
jgi:hypothetical protein